MGDSTPPAPALRKGSTKWFAISALAVAGLGFLAITVGGIGENLVYYWAPKDVAAAGPKAVGATIRLGGQVAVGSVKWGEGASDLEFDVTDGAATVHVVSKGVPPQLFRDRIGVVVEGTMTTAGQFESRRLMVSHDNKYRAPGDKDVDIKTLMRSTQGLEEPTASSGNVPSPRP
ncbi:MAG TPA: cytochrome c maturation protein CcmE [Vicinamibacteria bacterium]|jgi:cytochrome c-type biogenesis protein CcmE|nr:cytochrome c maturation protein CcmE [Vicinamibacteria bacterium]